MNRIIIFISLVLVVIFPHKDCIASQKEDYQRANLPIRPAHTFSIVALDPKTGELGAAVQSHWFSVGADVIWAEPGVGAVATQSFVEVSYGPLGLQMMRNGASAKKTLQTLLSKDEHEDVRQVGMVDANGVVANHTGNKAIIAHCEQLGSNYSVQANLMENDTVCAAMAKAFESTKSDLAGRMMAALEAAQKAGGDIRGKQSAALLVVKGDKNVPKWKGKVFDLRIEDDLAPVKEMKRLLHVARGYNKMLEGDNFMTVNKVEQALQSYAEAEKMLPGNYEAIYWHAVTLAAINRVEESLPLFRKAFKLHPPLRELTKRLPHSGLLPDDKMLIKSIIDVK